MVKCGFCSVGMIGCVTIALMAAAPARANLVVNGGFESSLPGSWSVEYAAAGSSVGRGAFSHSGIFSLALGANEFLYDEVYQVLPTTAGQIYRLEFQLYDSVQGDDSFQVAWEGGTVLDLTPVTEADGAWTPFTFDLLATGSGSELRFRGYDDSSSFVFVDDVSVTAVPAPGALVLGFLGLGGVVARRRNAASP